MPIVGNTSTRRWDDSDDKTHGSQPREFKMIAKLAAGSSGHDGGGNDHPASTDRFEYEMSRLPRDVTTAITWFMKENKISQADLARELKVTPGRVSQILSGDENLTLRTLAAVCVALDAHFEVDLISNTTAEARWDDAPV